MAVGPDGRLDGWKMIAAYFGRDRSTVMRWTQERSMPVHAVPGGRTRTVFAYRHELERWARCGGPDGPVSVPREEAPGPSGSVATRRGPSRRPRLAWIGASGILTLLAAILLRPHDRLPEPQNRLPADQAVAAIFAQARDDWAVRTRGGLARAIAGFSAVTGRDPAFAPAYAYLADAYLLETEDGPLDDDVAFARASRSAGIALRLDPNLAAAHRAEGFIAYWQRHDRRRAVVEFRRALALEAGDWQTHFWFANVLADAGDAVAATREFDRARVMSPGSPEIAIDRAWARWSAGATGEAAAELGALVRSHPDSAEAFACLSDVRLGAGDVAGYLSAIRRGASLRGNRALLRDADSLGDALRSGGPRAAERRIVDREMGRQAVTRFPDHSLAAFVASVGGDRAALVTALDAAILAREQWGSAGYVRRMEVRWAADPGVLDRLARLHGQGSLRVGASILRSMPQVATWTSIVRPGTLAL